MVLPSLWVANAAAADLSLEGLARYRGYFGDIDGFPLQEQLFQEQLRAELDTVLVRRAIGVLNVGFAIDHTLTLGPGLRSQLLGFQFHGQVDLDPLGALPIRLYGSRQTTGVDSQFPGYAVRSDTVGYRAAVRPDGLPRLESTGLYQRRLTGNQDVVSDQRTSLVNATLSHNDNRLLALAQVEVRRTEDPIASTRRDLNEADAFLEYRLDRNASFVGRGRTRHITSQVNGAPAVIDVSNADGTFTTRPSRKLTGIAYYRVNEQRTDDLRTGDATVGSTLTWYPTREWMGAAQVGVGNAWLTDATGLHPTFGEFVNLSANHTHWTARGGWQLFAQSGVASLQAPSANGAGTDGTAPLDGVQAGGVAGAVLRRAVGPIVLSGGANGGRQFDTSAREQSYLTWGWLAEASTRTWQGVQIRFQASQAVVDQRVLEVGDSDRLQVVGLAVLRPTDRLNLSYGLNAYRTVLDAEESSGIGHSASLRAVPLERVQLLGVFQYLTTSLSAFSGTETWRGEAQARLRLRPFDALARVSTTRASTGETRIRETVAWLEVSRAFDWRIE